MYEINRNKTKNYYYLETPQTKTINISKSIKDKKSRG